MREPALGARPSETEGRPPPAAGLVPSSTSNPAAMRLLTRAETAEVDNPVARATSALLHRGRDWTADSIARPFRLSNDSVPCPLMAAAYSRGINPEKAK